MILTEQNLLHFAVEANVSKTHINDTIIPPPKAGGKICLSQYGCKVLNDQIVMNFFVILRLMILKNPLYICKPYSLFLFQLKK